MAEAEQELKTYRGNCHCGAFIFELDLPAELKTSAVCNCSLCLKKGYYWNFPVGDSFKLVKGEEKDLAKYTFNTGMLHHYFCSNCGTALYARNVSESRPVGTRLIVNIRALQGPIELGNLQIKPFDGAAIAGDWKAAEYKGPEPEGGPADDKIYHGSCHCGAVTVALQYKDLETLKEFTEEHRVLECNCSICQRNGYIWFYPPKSQVVIQGRENMSNYAMGGRSFNKPFCKTCGVPITSESKDMTEEEIAALDELTQSYMVRAATIQLINLRLLDGFDFRKLETKRMDGYNHSVTTPYVNPSP